jgi:kynureninase
MTQMNAFISSPVTREMAQAMDRSDPLAGFRKRFLIDEQRPLYMDGNSMGRQPIVASALVMKALEAWQNDLIIAWREWIRLPRALGDLIGRSVIEARPGEVIVGDSTSVNLYKAAAAAVLAQPNRRTVITTDDNFPTDIYVLESLASQFSLRLKVLPADPVEGLDRSLLRRELDSDTALVSLSHVAYRSGALLEMSDITRVVHGAGALMLWDVSHSAGSVEVPLESSGADLAVGCTYKYLNGGPGSPSFVYVRSAEQRRLRQPIWGWFGHREQFAMGSTYEPADGIEAYLAGIPAILSLLPIHAGVAELAEAGITQLRDKGQQMTELLIQLAEQWLVPHGFSLASPRDRYRRGSHITFQHPSAKDYVRRLIARNVIPDYRPPDMIRFGPAPLYTRFVDVWDAMDELRRLCVHEGRGD